MQARGVAMTLGRVRGRLAKLAAVLARPRLYRGLACGVVAGVEHLAVLRRLAPATVIDVGAHRGQFALAVRAVLPAARIVALEPQPAAAARFRRVFAGDARVRLHPVAAAARNGEATLYLAGRSDSSSLLPPGALQAKIFPGTAEVARRRVSCVRLDALLATEALAPPVLLKLDVQGGELAALEGATDWLDRVAWVYAECSTLPLYDGQPMQSEVAAWLAAQGFRCVGRFNVVRHRDYGPVQADVLFTRA